VEECNALQKDGVILNQNKRPGEETTDKRKEINGRKEDRNSKGAKIMGTINLKSLYSVPFMPVLFITPPWWYFTEVSNE